MYTLFTTCFMFHLQFTGVLNHLRDNLLIYLMAQILITFINTLLMKQDDMLKINFLKFTSLTVC